MSSSSPSPGPDPDRDLASARRWIAAGALLAAAGVALGAFGAHGLRTRVTPRDLEIFETAVRYQLVHALGILACGTLLSLPRPVPAGTAAAWLVLGIVLFSGSLYLLVGTGIRQLGMVTPLGGTAFLVGWILLARAALR